MAVTIPIVAADQPPRAAANINPAQGASLSSLPPLSVYVHVPWCVRRCPYCDFNSHEAPDGGMPEADYLAALRRDLEQSLPSIWGRQVHTVFIGGGTPSLLSAAGMDELLAMLRACLNLWPDAEITMEANPGTAEAVRLRDYAASGINRMSLGIQSFDDASLRKLGRIHDARQAHAAIEMAQRAVGRVNLDLMYALPGQNLAGCLADLDTALSFGVEHLSLYHLTMEPQTVFAKYPPADLPDEDTAAAMQDAVEAQAAEAGYERYEVSAYAKPGASCRHNLNYWSFGDYLGIGPGAHGKLSFAHGIERQARLRSPASWMAAVLRGDGSHVAETRQIEASELPFEFMLNALRLREGVPASWYAERTGLSLVGIMHRIDAAVGRGLLDPDPRHFRATALGWRFLNDLQEIFL